MGKTNRTELSLQARKWKFKKTNKQTKKNGSCGTSKVSNAATPEPVLGQTQLMLQADGRQACLLS